MLKLPSTCIPSTDLSTFVDLFFRNGNGDRVHAPIDEAAMIEERRKRREALKAKYKGSTPSTPLLVQALQPKGDSTASTPTMDGSISHSRRSGWSNVQASANESSPLCTESPNLSPPQSPSAISGPASPSDLPVIRDEDLANKGVVDTAMTGTEADEPSAADYDPSMDMDDDRLKHDRRVAGDEVPARTHDERKPAKQDVLIPEHIQQETKPAKAKDPFDMFAEEEDDDDDMFAEEGAVAKEKPESSEAVPVAKQLDVSMLDNWDDHEGYYRVIRGELIDSRYQVQMNLGKGMFSSVVRAMDSQTNKLVAIKIVRNNETM